MHKKLVKFARVVLRAMRVDRLTDRHTHRNDLSVEDGDDGR